MPRPPKPHTRIFFRSSVELYQWLKEYSSRNGRTMSAIIKEQLESLRRKDELSRHPETKHKMWQTEGKG
jgi:predicted DNA-binding protein